MLWQILIALGALLLAGSIHFLILGKSNRYLTKRKLLDLSGFLLMLMAATIGQIIAAGIFAAAFWVSSEAGLGGFQMTEQSGWMEIYYFSLVNLTTLGLGDIIPLGHLKFLTAIEAMTGFLLISCSASHIFLMMQKREKAYE